MAGAVTISGFGSGMDINALIDGLVKASSVRLNSLQTRSSGLQSATTTLSDISRSLSSLQTAADALSSATSLNSMKATSSSAAIVASANGAAAPVSMNVQVQSLAKEQKTYSSRQATSGALGQSGNMTVGVGEKSGSISVNSDDSLDDIAGKINGLGLRVNASVFYDGEGYRLQIRGLDTGAANSLTLTENGTTLDLNGTSPAGGTGGRTVQSASDAVLLVDGYTVTRPTNQITGLTTGVTLALTAETTQATTITVAGDSAALQTKLSSFVSAYNGVIKAVHAAAGYGTTKATNDALAGDSALRTVNDRLLSLVGSANGSGSVRTLADVGVSLDRDGMLVLDNNKLSNALSKDASAVTSLLARPTGATTGGIMANIEDALKAMTDSSAGVLSNRLASINKQIKDLNSQATSEQTRLDAYAERLRTQFTAMDTAMASSKSLLASLNSMFGTSSSK